MNNNYKNGQPFTMNNLEQVTPKMNNRKSFASFTFGDTSHAFYNTV